MLNITMPRRRNFIYKDSTKEIENIRRIFYKGIIDHFVNISCDINTLSVTQINEYECNGGDGQIFKDLLSKLRNKIIQLRITTVLQEIREIVQGEIIIALNKWMKHDFNRKIDVRHQMSLMTRYHFVKVLQWWKDNCKIIKIKDNCLDNVLYYLPSKYFEKKPIDTYPFKHELERRWYNISETLEWWFNSGFELKYCSDFVQDTENVDIIRIFRENNIKINIEFDFLDYHKLYEKTKFNEELLKSNINLIGEFRISPYESYASLLNKNLDILNSLGVDLKFIEPTKLFENQHCLIQDDLFIVNKPSAFLFAYKFSKEIVKTSKQCWKSVFVNLIIK